MGNLKNEDRHEKWNQTAANSLHRRYENETESDHKQESRKNGNETSNQPGSSPTGKRNKHHQSRKAEEKKDIRKMFN